MIAVIFEVVPVEDRSQAYMDLAGQLLPLLKKVDGFISVERYESLTQPGKILSLSFWRDEHAIAEWRATEHHRQAQTAGRHNIFSDYRLRIGDVIRDYGMTDRQAAPEDSRKFHEEPGGS